VHVLLGFTLASNEIHMWTVVIASVFEAISWGSGYFTFFYVMATNFMRFTAICLLTEGNLWFC
jgi:hypothetical protein